MAAVQTPSRPEAPDSVGNSVGGPLRQHFRDYVSRLRGGEIGSLPAVLGLIALVLVFTALRPVFFSAGNFANLFTQGGHVTIIAMGLVFVLLLGEIDLSAGFTSGLCGAVLCVLLTEHHVVWYLSVLAAVLIGTAIGLLLGFLVAKVGIPSFVVTLAAFLAFQGVVLRLLSGGRNISVFDTVIVAIDNNNLTPWMGWLMVGVCVVGYALAQLAGVRGRAKRGLGSDPLSLVAIRVGAVLLVCGPAVYFLNRERSRNPLFSSLKGVPIVVPIILVLLLLWTFVLRRTTFGRHLYAVGGSREAARRAGINVDRIRIAAFMISSSMAAIGGIVAVSRGRSVDPNTGGSNILLYAVGAAVIGGTSLFGGKGRSIDAVIGGAVVAVIDNGMGLLGADAGGKYIITGLVLLAAATIDAVSRRRAAANGLR